MRLTIASLTWIRTNLICLRNWRGSVLMYLLRVRNSKLKTLNCMAFAVCTDHPCVVFWPLGYCLRGWIKHWSNSLGWKLHIQQHLLHLLCLVRYHVQHCHLLLHLHLLELGNVWLVLKLWVGQMVLIMNSFVLANLFADCEFRPNLLGSNLDYLLLDRGFLRLASLVTSRDLLLINFLIVEEVEYLSCGFICLQHDYRLFWSLLVVYWNNLIFRNHIIYFQDNMLIHLPSHITEDNNFGSVGMFDDSFPSEWRIWRSSLLLMLWNTTTYFHFLGVAGHK